MEAPCLVSVFVGNPAREQDVLEAQLRPGQGNVVPDISRPELVCDGEGEETRHVCSAAVVGAVYVEGGFDEAEGAGEGLWCCGAGGGIFLVMVLVRGCGRG